MSNTRSHIHMPTDLGASATDRITAFSGSWLFVLLHVLWFVLWFVLRLDINLLTLIVSLEAIYLSTFVLMSQNRSAAKDKARDDLEASEVTEMYHINQRQLEILEILHELQGEQEAQA